jgi:hypothetical protein
VGQNFPATISNIGGANAALNVTAAKVIKATPGSVMRVIVQVVPSAGSLTLNDNNATGGTNVAANQIFTALFGTTPLLVAGTVITLECPCLTGITVSSVGTGGVYTITYN